jgi:hypothetical protein
MYPLSRVLVFVLILAVFAPSPLSAQEIKKGAVPAYLLSWTIGFGAGHFYLQDDAAYKFLLLESTTVAVMVLGTTLMAANWDSGSEEAILIGTVVDLVGVLVFLGVRIWELFDVVYAVDEMRARGRIAVKPTIRINQDNIIFGVSYVY